jgi:ADP-ribose pyrophosphatase YjhB (NUDIX family)
MPKIPMDERPFMIRHTKFRFCPRCGSQKIGDRGDKAMLCGDCGFQYFHNTASAAALLLESEGGLVLARRNENPAKGLLDLPGGFADYGESFESALRREIREEIGLEPGELAYFGSFPNTYEFGGVIYFTTDAVFKAPLPEGFTPRFNAEISELVEVRRDSVAFDQLAFDVTRLVLRTYWDVHPPD